MKHILTVSTTMRNFDYLEPTTVAEACALLKQHAGEAKVFAGGSHLTILMKQGLYQPKALVNIKKISELKGIKYDEKEGLSIGALVTHREIETSALVREKFPVLCDAEREVANIRVRNMGTVGGNLASGEPLTDLIANLYRAGRESEDHRPRRTAHYSNRRTLRRLLYDKFG